MRKTAIFHHSPWNFSSEIQVNCCKRITFSKSYPFNAIPQNFLLVLCKLIRINFWVYVAYTCIPPDEKMLAPKFPTLISPLTHPKTLISTDCLLISLILMNPEHFI